MIFVVKTHLEDKLKFIIQEKNHNNFVNFKDYRTGSLHLLWYLMCKAVTGN